MDQEAVKIKYILYARKSTESEDKQVLSIDSQIDELRALVKRNHTTVNDVRREAHSAKGPGRPVFNEMLNDIERGNANGIVVWHPDRLSRNSVDTGRLIYLFDLGKLQEIVTPSQSFRNTPSDKFLLNLLCSQAKLENDNKGINVKRGLKAKAERGIYPAPAPLGYVNEKYAERGRKRILPDPERYDLVKKMFDLMLTGKYSPLRIRDIANNEWGFRGPNGKPLVRSSIYYIFTRPFYAGIFEYPVGSGNWHKGIHEPMITEEQYDQIQAILGRKGKPRPKKHIFSFTSMMRCGECNCMVTAEEKTKRQQNGNVHRYIYYHCTKKKNPNCPQRSIEEKKLRKQIAKAIDEVAIPPEFHEWAMKWYQKVHAIEAGDTNLILLTQQKAYRECVEKIDNLIDMRAAESITDEEFKRKRSKLMREKLRLEELLADTGVRVNAWLEKAENVFAFCSEARDRFKNGDREKRRQILATLGSNLTLTDKKLRIDMDKILIAMKDVATEVQAIHREFEPRKSVVTKEEIEQMYAQSPRLLPG